VRLAGLSGLATVQAEKVFQFSYRDLDVPGTIQVMTEVASGPNTVQISRMAELPDDGLVSVQLIRSEVTDPGLVLLYVQTIKPGGKAGPARRITAGSLPELARKDPADVDAYLRPIFRMFAAEARVFAVDSKTACQALADLYPVDAATAAAADAAVSGLGADSFADREAALQRLRDLGEPAAIHLIQSRGRALSDEQTMRVELFLAPYRPLGDDEMPRQRQNPDFLLDCLFNSDPQIRRLALEQCRRVIGRPISLDLNLAPPAFDDAVTALRQTLVNPTTQPWR
jgi:hypothetical protein